MVVGRRRRTTRVVLAGLCLASAALVGHALVSTLAGPTLAVLEPFSRPTLVHAAGPGDLAARAEPGTERRQSLEQQFASLREQSARRRRSADRGPGWIARAIEDLADDDVRMNACNAIHALSHGGEEVIEPLRAALDSVDHQQRQLAAMVLQRLDVEPDDRLLEVSLEGLRCDGVPYGEHFTPNADNEGSSARYLLKHFELVRADLGPRLYSDDGLERFLSAYILVRGGDRSALSRCCAILVDHLQDNDVNHDAKLAAQALGSLGEAAVPYLTHAQAFADEQAGQLIGVLLRDVWNPARNADERWERSKAFPRGAVIHRAERDDSGPYLGTSFAGPTQWNSPRGRLSRLREAAGHSSACSY